jgi:hypothetical protein
MHPKNQREAFTVRLPAHKPNSCESKGIRPDPIPGLSDSSATSAGHREAVATLTVTL